MSPLAVRIGAGVLALLALIALRGKRWAYLAFVVLGLLYFPAQTHFRVHAPKCELLLPAMHLLVPLLHNYLYIALFAGCYWMSWVQFGRSDARGVWALVATLLLAALVEVAEGMTGGGRGQVHCRVRDLVPDAAGAVGAALLLAIWSRLRRKPAYVRLVKPRPAAAPHPAAPPPRAVVPPRGVVPPPASRPPVPPPPDFSPGPSPVTPPADVARTEQVARSKNVSARRQIVQQLQAILGRLRPMSRRLWAIVRGRRRTMIVGGVIVALVGAGAFVILRLPAPASVVTEQPAPPPEPPPPPPRPLQSEAEGYYEPSYQFTVSDRRLTRLTLRPQPFVTFSRPGIRDEVACADARITPAAVRLRCEFERVGIVVAIDGQFPSRSVTSSLDAPVLNAWITITNTRGETLYRARESFLWHAPD
ncbi:MAG TPA: hypothetical protein VGJ80_08110 [Gemmatimonadales bacterium]|jgi:hypothetical protein